MSVFQAFHKVIANFIQSKPALMEDWPYNKILVYPKAKRPQLKPLACLSTGRNVTSRLSFL